MKAKDFQAEVEIEVPFHDLDAMEMVWHGHYWKYFEIARTALYRSIDYDLPVMRDTCYAWPVIDCQCRFIKPLRYGMKVRIIATLLEYELRLRIGYVMHDVATGERLCKGETTQVAVDMRTKEMCIGSPDVLLQRLGVKK